MVPDTQATDNTRSLLEQIEVVKVCRRCGSTDWDFQTLTCTRCGLTSYANSSKRRFKQATHHRRSTFNRRKAGHGGQVKRSLATL